MRTTLRLTGLAALVAAALVASAPAASAHHSFAPFDLTASKSLTGTVNRFEWTNPHTWIFIDVPNGKGGVDTWGVEGMSPNYLKRRGWTRETIKPGDKITILIHPMRNGQTGGMFVSATLANGEVLRQTGDAKD